jgi:hypothetical protein
MSGVWPSVVAVSEPNLTSEEMSDYECARWAELQAHWNKDRRQLIPAKTRKALTKAGDKVSNSAMIVGVKVADVTPQAVKDAGGFIADAALEPTIKATLSLLEFTTRLVSEFTDPEKVLQYHRSQGRDIQTLDDLRALDLKELDEFTRRMSMKWRGIGTAQGAALGLVATLPVAGTGASIALDVLISHALTTAIATRVAYSYGFDASDPDQQAFIDKMVQRAYMQQAPKIGAVREAARAAQLGAGRVRWSDKLRQDARMLAAVEKLMKQFSSGQHIPVEKVVSKMPLIGIVTGAGFNQQMLGDVAQQARHYAATHHLAAKYDLTLPERLKAVSLEVPEDE